MLPVALEYYPGDRNGVHVYRPARGGRSCEHFGGYNIINRIPSPTSRYRTGLKCVAALTEDNVKHCCVICFFSTCVKFLRGCYGHVRRHDRVCSFSDVSWLHCCNN